MYSKFKEYRLRRDLVVEILSFLFILLFMYAAVSKLLDYEQFRVQIGQSPMLSAFAGWIAWVVPSVEIIISLMLMVPRLRLFAFFAAFSLMVMFTTYIFLKTIWELADLRHHIKNSLKVKKSFTEQF